MHAEIDSLILLLQVPYSIPSFDDYHWEYSLHCNLPGENVHSGSFPLPSTEFTEAPCNFYKDGNCSD